MYNCFMKLVIQIPCFNEQDTILGVLNSIPKTIKGVDEILIFLLDDGSNDDTVKIAKEFGVQKIISSKTNIGLAKTFMKGVEASLESQADILVNIDGDNQYKASEIEKLIQPILENKADIVVGSRPIDKIQTFSFLKKNLQKFGSLMVKLISNINIKDAPSGFRAYSKNALLNINVFNDFTYTIETILQAKDKNLILQNVDIEVNEQKNRKSKLFSSNFDYIFKQTKNLIRFFIIYQPAKFFVFLANILFSFGFLLGLRFLYFYFNLDGQGHIQSLILCSIVLILSFICYMLAIIGDLFSINRKLMENVQFELRQKKYKK